MDVLVSVVDGSSDEARSLDTWLAEDPAVRRYGRVRHGSGGRRPEDMGALDVLSVVVGSGLSLSQLLWLVVNWRASRPQPVLVRVQVAGRTVEVRTNRVEDVPRIVEELEADIGGAPDGS